MFLRLLLLQKGVCSHYICRIPHFWSALRPISLSWEERRKWINLNHWLCACLSMTAMYNLCCLMGENVSFHVLQPGALHFSSPIQQTAKEGCQHFHTPNSPDGTGIHLYKFSCTWGLIPTCVRNIQKSIKVTYIYPTLSLYVFVYNLSKVFYTST